MTHPHGYRPEPLSTRGGRRRQDPGAPRSSAVGRSGARDPRRTGARSAQERTALRNGSSSSSAPDPNRTIRRAPADGSLPRESTTLGESYATLQATPADRLAWARQVRQRLSYVPLERAIALGPLRGSGEFGRVYAGRFPDSPFPLAVKIATRALPLPFVRQEIVAATAAGRLVERGVAPNFVLTLYDQLRVQGPVPFGQPPLASCCVVMEHADGTLKRLVKANAGDGGLIMSVSIQTLMAIAAMASVDMSHNDMYLRNVLWNAIEPDTRFAYARRLLVPEAAATEVYAFRTAGVLVKVADFGRTSAPAVGIPHPTPLRPPPAIEETLARGTEDACVAPDTGMHVLYANMPTFSRDLFAFVTSMLRVLDSADASDTPWSAWLADARDMLSESLDLLNDPEASLRLIDRMLRLPEAQRHLLKSVADGEGRLVSFGPSELPHPSSPLGDQGTVSRDAS